MSTFYCSDLPKEGESAESGGDKTVKVETANKSSDVTLQT